jgi:integrase
MYRNSFLFHGLLKYHGNKKDYFPIHFMLNVISRDLMLSEHPILKSGIRILRPSEFKTIKNSITNREKQVLIDALLFTGLRYEEAVRLRHNPDWFDGNFIHLPEWAQQKARRKQRERWVRLSIPGKYVMREFFSITVPSRIAFDKWLAYNFPLIEGLSAKSFRKTWESWLLFSFPDKAMEIALSQGHTELTQLRHYANLPFLDKDREEMKEFVVGWA